MNGLFQDLRYALRQLRKSPAFAAVAILSLALGTGANTAIFQLLDAVRLRNLPIPNPKELAEVRIVGGNHGFGINDGLYAQLTRPIWQEIREHHEPWLVLRRSLPIQDTEQMHVLTFSRAGGNSEDQFSYPEFAEIQKQTTDVFSGTTPFVLGGTMVALRYE